MNATTSPDRPASAVSARTQELLILAGERLFAAHGIDAVSMRQINIEAGQRNSSASHYHFGSKESLVQAIYEYRMERVNRRRIEMLNALAGTGQQQDERTIARTIVDPIVTEIETGQGGSFYIRFLAQMIGHPHMRLEEVRDSRHTEGMSRVTALLRAALPQLPPAILAQRLGLAWEQTIHALADRERLTTSASGDVHVRPALFVGNLTDMVAGALSAPVSPATGAELKQDS